MIRVILVAMAFLFGNGLVMAEMPHTPLAVAKARKAALSAYSHYKAAAKAYVFFSKNKVPPMKLRVRLATAANQILNKKKADFSTRFLMKSPTESERRKMCFIIYLVMGDITKIFNQYLMLIPIDIEYQRLHYVGKRRGELLAKLRQAQKVWEKTLKNASIITHNYNVLSQYPLPP